MRLLPAMDATTPPALPPTPVGAGAYAAVMPEGTLGLALETVSGQPPAGAAEAAVRLAQAEPLLAGLELWLAQAPRPAAPPEWVWCATPVAPPSGAALARWAGVGVGARLALPWALLRRLPAPPPALGLQWSPVAAEQVLATLELSAADRAALEPGGALLLPGSFASGAAAGLRAADEPAPDAGPGGEHWEVRRAVSAPLSPEHLLGWRQDEPLPPNGDAPLTLWRLVAGEPPAPWARGRCVPWGEGHALLLDEIAGFA